MDDRFQHLLGHQGQLVHVDHSHRLADHEQAATGFGIDSSTQKSTSDSTIFVVKHIRSDKSVSVLGMARASAMYFTVTEVMRKTKAKVDDVLESYISERDGTDREKFIAGKGDFNVKDGVTEYKLEKVNGKFQCSVRFTYKHQFTGELKETTVTYTPTRPGGMWMPDLDEDAKEGVFYIFKQFVDERVFAVQEHVRNPVRARVYMARLVNRTQP